MELIRKALPGSQLAPRPFPIKRGTHQLMTKTTVQQEGIPHHIMDDDDMRQQAKELFKRISQQSKTDEPLQKLCNALYTCDPHRTGKGQGVMG